MVGLCIVFEVVEIVCEFYFDECWVVVVVCMFDGFVECFVYCEEVEVVDDYVWYFEFVCVIGDVVGCD